MGQSWSDMRKQLEQEYLCDSLKGRIQFFVTRYPRTFDEHTRIAIRVDGEELLKSDFVKWHRAAEGTAQSGIEIHNKGGFDSVEFYNAFYAYQNQSIQKSLFCEDPLVRLFAILDRRVGKRSLQKILPSIQNQPGWLRPFYLLRLTAEDITGSTA